MEDPVGVVLGNHSSLDRHPPKVQHKDNRHKALSSIYCTHVRQMSLISIKQKMLQRKVWNTTLDTWWTDTGTILHDITAPVLY